MKPYIKWGETEGEGTGGGRYSKAPSGHNAQLHVVGLIWPADVGRAAVLQTKTEEGTKESTALIFHSVPAAKVLQKPKPHD